MKSTQGWLIAVAGLSLALAGCTAADRASDEIGTVEGVEPVRRSLTVCLDSIVSRKSVRLLWKPRRHRSLHVEKCSADTDCGSFTNTAGDTREFFLWASGTLYPNQLGGLGETCGLTIDCEAVRLQRCLRHLYWLQDDASTT